MQTKSESLFEAFLNHHDLTWEKVSVDTSVPQSFRPDYLVRIGKHDLVFE